MNQPKTSKAEATKRPWHRHDMEHDSICGPDHKAIALVMGRSRSKDEDAANLSFIVQAVNEYEALNAVAEAARMAWSMGQIVGGSKLAVDTALSALAALRAKEK